MKPPLSNDPRTAACRQGWLSLPGGQGKLPLRILGNPELLRLRFVAILESRQIPAELVLPTFDLCRALRDAAVPMCGGFQGAIQGFCFDLLLRGRQPLLLLPARSMDGFRVRARWKEAIEVGRLAIASRLPPRWKRTSSRSADVRNETLLELADSLFVVHAPPGSRTFDLAVRAIDVGRSTYCFDHAANRELLVIGAAPVDTRSPGAGAADLKASGHAFR
jgi:predicted Rossmann fold nucleotide-binding protein DprA/Smf involved in DNA uptake